jgi:hypothetical protein
MSFLDPLARSLEHFVYERVCALSVLAPPERGSATERDALATPLAGSTPPRRRR